MFEQSKASVPAGFWLRLAAHILDDVILSLIVIAALIPLTFLVPLDELQLALGSKDDPTVSVIFLACVLFYKAGFEGSSWQATPGKRVVGLSVVNSNFEPISPIRAFFRNAFKFFSYMMLGLGFLLAALPGKKRALHDLMAGAHVIKRG